MSKLLNLSFRRELLVAFSMSIDLISCVLSELKEGNINIANANHRGMEKSS